MKKVLSIALIALLAITSVVMTSCKKETEEEATANTLVYNGKVYNIQSTYSYDDYMVYVDAKCLETNDEGLPLFTIIADNPENGTYDLPSQEIFFGVRSSVETIESFGPEDLTEGTATIYKDDEAMTYKVQGTLKSGSTFSFYLYMPASEWRYIVYDK